MMIIINIFRRPKYPLFREALQAHKDGGVEGLRAWVDSLSPEKHDRFILEGLDVLTKAVDIAAESVREDIRSGKIKRGIQ